jgi:hypothetical protein
MARHRHNRSLSRFDDDTYAETSALEEVYSLVAHAKLHFPDAFASLPIRKYDCFVDFQCECCSISFEGLWIGRTFTSEPPCKEVKVIATVDVRGIHCGQMRLFLVQGCTLLEHNSYSLAEADQLCLKYRYPFLFLAPNPDIANLEALCRYYLSILSSRNVFNGTSSQFRADFERVCRFFHRPQIRDEVDNSNFSSTLPPTLETKIDRSIRAAREPQKSMYCSFSMEITVLTTSRPSNQLASRFGNTPPSEQLGDQESLGQFQPGEYN